MKRSSLAVGLLLFTLIPATRIRAAAAFSPDELPPGLAVCLGCDEAKWLPALRGQTARVVHAPDAFDGEYLPYVDNLVNAIVSVGGPSDGLRREMLRVLAPGGVAVILKGSSDAVLERFHKPRPATIDNWTHFLHGADNNAVARDSLVGPPAHVQWLAGPKWTRHHDVDKGGNPSVRPVLTAGGRIYTIIDETPSSDMTKPGTWFLQARDAFNGILLWKKPVKVERGTLEKVWRTMVVDEQNVYAPLGPGEPLSVVDGRTGQTLRSCAETTGYTEVVKDGAGVFVVIGRAVVSASAETGKHRWTWRAGERESIVRLTLAAAGGRVFVRTDKRVCCLAGDTGVLTWEWAASSHRKPVMKRRVATHERLIVAKDVVLVSHGGKDPNVLSRDAHIYKGSHARVHDYGGKLSALSVDEGRVLWTTDYLPSIDDRKPGEHYVVGDTVWLGPDYAQPRDLRTGRVRQTRDVLGKLWTDGHHYRCYPAKATTRYVMTPKRGLEMFDLEGDGHSRNNWLRSTCTIGVTPANGLIYNPPHSCGCYMEAQLFGFWAVAGRDARTQAPAIPDPQRLEKGPAYGQVPNISASRRSSVSAFQRSSVSAFQNWPTYRGSNERAGSCPQALPDGLRMVWSADPGGQLSAVSVGDGKVFVASADRELLAGARSEPSGERLPRAVPNGSGDPFSGTAVSRGVADRHTLHALSLKTGKTVWQFRAGGGIDSPPTYAAGAGSLLLGARDGWVYCLRASDGALVWRFLAARARVNTVAFGQVESVWPVHGAVLVHAGTAYVCAGRSSYLDGGIDIYGLDVATGEVLHRRTVTSTPAGAMDPPEDAAKYAKKINQNWLDYLTFVAPDKSDSFSMSGLRVDVMSARGGDVFLRHMAFDAALEPRDSVAPHLMSTSSLLDDTQHNRSYWILGTGNFARTPVSYPWILQKQIGVPYGVMMSFDEKTVWCIRQQGRKRGPVAYELVAVPRPNPADPGNRQPDFAKSAAPKPLWRVKLPLFPRAMLRAGQAVYVAGVGEGPVLLTVTRDGIRRSQPLPARPAWDGMAATATRLFVPLENASLVCLGE